MVQTFYMLKEM